VSDIAIQNNPARRLHTIIKQLKSRTNDNLDAAFANVLGVDVADYALLVKRIGHVYFLVDLSKRAVESIDGINHEKYIAPIKSVGEALKGLGFAHRVDQTPIGKIPVDTMAYLDMTAEYLSTHAPEPTISEENRAKIEESIRSLQEELVSQSDMPLDLMRYLFEKLDGLLQAVQMYGISGAYPVRDAAESIVGATVIQRVDYQNQPKCWDLLDKVFRCAASAYCSIEVINNAAQLPESVKALAGLLGG